jgi:replicative DNA helicase
VNQNLPPCCIEAEEAILGGILFDPQAIYRIEAELHPQAFYVSAHQEIYQAALKLHRQGKSTDLISVTTYLTDWGKLDRVGGITKLTQLLNRIVSAVNIDRYALLVMDKYLRRKTIEVGNKIVDFGYDNTIELDVLLDSLEREVFSISQHKMKFDTEPNSEIAAAAFNQLEANTPIYPTGVHELDNLMVGFEPGTLTILAGRPSMGKSAIALFLALKMMIQHQLSVAIFSLEMTKKQLEYRLWSLISQFDCYSHLNLTPIRGDRLRKYRAGLTALNRAELDSIAQIVAIATELPLYMNDNRGITVSGLASECRQIQAREGQLGLVIVDYLQMMAADSGGNRSYELGDVARGLYKLAGDLNVPVLALSQVSRGVESRQNKRPMMSDLSQSGILEMVADNLIFVYRDEYYHRDTLQPGILELILAKARHGQTGTAEVLFDSASGLIRSLAEFV